MSATTKAVLSNGPTYNIGVGNDRYIAGLRDWLIVSHGFSDRLFIQYSHGHKVITIKKHDRGKKRAIGGTGAFSS